MNYKKFEHSPDVLSRQPAIEIVKPHQENLCGVFHDAWGGWMRLRELAPKECKPFNATTRATIVHQYIVEFAKRRFPNGGCVLSTEQHKVLELVFNDKIVIRFKKLDDALHSSGIPTGQRLDFTRQIYIEGLERTNLIAGYRLDESETRIKDIHIICPINPHRNLWSYELESQVETGTYLEVTPVGTEESAKVSAKGTRKQKGNVS